MLSQSDLDAIRSRAEAASNGEWEFDHDTEWVTRLAQKDGRTHEILVILDVYTAEDATFIAHARTDVPALLDTIAEARAELVKHFDDIDIDYEGEPNDLDYMVQLAGEKLRSTRKHREMETERANVAEHKNSQLRSRFALELAARTTPDTAELQRQANRITELEDVGKDNQYIVETLAKALRVDLGAHGITELAHAAADMIERLRSANAVERRWQEVDRPKLESRVAELEARLYGTGTTKYDRIEALEAAQVPRDMVDTPSSGVKFWAIVQLRYHEPLSEMEGFKVLLDDDDFTWVEDQQAKFLGWLPLPDQKSGVEK